MVKPGTSDEEWKPKVWADDEKMAGYMAMLKARVVNSIDYDRKVQFWTDVVDGFCGHEHLAITDLPTLKSRFRRGQMVPASLPAVLENMKNFGIIVLLDDWKEKHSTWMDWGVSRLQKTSSWLFGATQSIERSKFIHIPTLEKQAKEAITLYMDEFKSEVDGTGEVVAYADFYEKGYERGIFRTKENFDVLLDMLTDSGDLTIGIARNGHKILKFRDISSDGPAHFTDADASVHDIRVAMRNIERDINSLEDKAKKLDESCRKAIREGQKTRAASFLRQKKIVEKNISDKNGQLHGLLNMLHQLSSAKQNKQIIDVYKMSSKAFSEDMARHGLSPDKLDKTMDEISAAMEDYKEIEQALSQGFGTRNKEMDEELENELEELLAENEKVKEPELAFPSVPRANSFGLEDDARLEDELEKRLQRLRQDA